MASVSITGVNGEKLGKFEVSEVDETKQVKKLTKQQRKVQRDDHEHKKKFQKALKSVIVDKKSFNYVAVRSGFDRKTLERAAKINTAESVTGSVDCLVLCDKGRPPVMPAAGKKQLLKEVEENDALGDSARHIPPPRATTQIIVPGYDPSLTINSFAARANDLKNEYLRHHFPEASASAFQPLKPSTLSNLTKELNLDVVKNVNWQNARRKEALSDAYNYVSLAVMQIIAHAAMSGVSIEELKLNDGKVHLLPAYRRSVLPSVLQLGTVPHT